MDQKILYISTFIDKILLLLIFDKYLDCLCFHSEENNDELFQKCQNLDALLEHQIHNKVPTYRNHIKAKYLELMT